MANKWIFRSVAGTLPKAADGVNDAGGRAFTRSPHDALVQYAVTGTFNGTYYVDASEHLDRLLALCANVEPEFIVKTAVYARQRGFMKDMPAALLVYLIAHGEVERVTPVFHDIIDTPRMLRTFVQMVRSGVFGRKSFGSATRRLIRQWLAVRTPEQLFFASVGNAPSLEDIVKMVHPLPVDDAQQSIYRYILGKDVDREALPAVVRDFEAYKAEPADSPPAVPFEMLTGLPLTDGAWKTIAQNASWQQTRMNLNTFKRHNVFADSALVRLLADRLVDTAAARRQRAMPFQLFSAWLNNAGQIPDALTAALEQAAEAAVDNVPAFDGKVIVCVDTSGSMQWPITGQRGTASSRMRCVDVAGLVAASVYRKNPATKVVAFDQTYMDVPETELKHKSMMDVARYLATFGGGGTDCSIPLRTFNAMKVEADLVIYVSDNESWVDSMGAARSGRSTGMLAEWEQFRARIPHARLVCIDLTPNLTVQAPNRADILNVGGFSDTVFSVIDLFVRQANGLSLAEMVEQAVA